MRVDVVTIFPDMFGEVLGHGILRRARESGIVDLRVHDLRRFTRDRHRSTDDTPYGGGPGMVMLLDPLVTAVETIAGDAGVAPADRRVVLLSPRGEPMTQRLAERLACLKQLVLVAGRYEGVDERFSEITGALELSLGDYVVSGGELPAMIVIDAVVRLLPGALSDPESSRRDSFSRGLLDYPVYTRPAVFRGRSVPEVLLSGDHAAIERWRKEQSLRVTRERRPDLLVRAELDAEEREILREWEEVPG